MVTTVKGGSFVIDSADWNSVSTPEDLSGEQLMIAGTTEHFIENEVLPHDEALEKLDYGLTVRLIRKAGELGLLGVDIPEPYGGLGLDKVSSTLISEKLARGSSFALSVGAHVGIGTLPIVFFGTPEQKKRYLPDLADGSKIAAYCLTEPSSGSDALGARTTAKLSEDGTYYELNGTKQFITNAGFADVFIVYAKINGKLFSAFIVERSMEGVSIGPEEKKMGIKGSSTCPLILEGVRVPVSNLLGEPGKGHLIAFNILNIGRFKLGAGCVGGAKEAIALSASYANERTQFGKPISSFPLIGQKLAEMNIVTYVLESMVYRTAGLIDGILQDIDLSSEQAGVQSAKGIAEYALECSIIKVFGTEALDRVADEGVQIHGGYGFIQEYKIERIYRDSRINRIFEGTNEINRLLIPGTLLKKAMKGELPLMERAQSVQMSMLEPTSVRSETDDRLGEEKRLLATAKQIFLLIGGQAVQTYGMELEEQQEVLSRLADMMIRIYAMESALLRAEKITARSGAAKGGLAEAMTKVYVCEAFAEIEQAAKQNVAAMASGDLLSLQLSVLRKWTRHTPVDTISLKRRIAESVKTEQRYTVIR
ncbi:acyl-CoA dehydrogenase family protein [Paenibacillus oceani]|uniref:Acyl-CoA dehydrogenase family protein n=1 Tax=Paenibacillus oceani TaxID=2772510 RepID=A0A927CEI3_9BACL|nr:acyl-CoA dehydrogenase family protein [Paenibacillus oceani]MBD2865178.1 acyl-CoA dehydrogenase family protein [Paenibacillus oceani]